MGSSNTTAKYTAFYTNTGNGTTSYVYIPFDLSPIPDNADIDSVACTARARVNVTSGWSAGAAQLFTGNTAKGSSRALLYAAGANSSSLITLSPGTWTREELKNCRLRLSCTRSTNSTSNICIFFYGADLTVTYTYQSEKFMLKLGGSWTDVARVFKKVSGIWVEQTDLANVVDQTKRLVNGGEYVAPVVVTIGGSFYYEYSWVKVNGNRYTSAASVEVEPGTEVQIYTSSAFASLRSSCGVKLNGTAVLSGAGTYTHIADRNCTITMKENVSDGRAYYSAEITTG